MKIRVIKIGGKVLDDQGMLDHFIKDFAAIKEPKILVHGGGKRAAEISGKLGIPVQMHEGRRITTSETLETVVMVYAGLLNKTLVTKLQALGVEALGLCGADRNLIKAKKRPVAELDFGWVGDVDTGSVADDKIMQMLKEGVVPVFSAITHDGEGHLLNTNADAVASVLAASLAAHAEVELSLCFEGEGVRDASGKIALEIDKSSFQFMKEEKIVNSGMIAKLEEGFRAMSSGAEVIICSYRSLDAGSERKGSTLI